MLEFQPNYHNIIDSARNKKPSRYPLYEHIISEKVMEKILDYNFSNLYHGNESEKREYFYNYCKFFQKTGYDTVSFECPINEVMPNSGALFGDSEGAIRTREDYENYPWEDIPHNFFKKYSNDFKLLKEQMPEGMNAIGGPGNGVFECVQDLVGFEKLCYIWGENPKLFSDIFTKTGKIIYKIWKEFLLKFADIYAVCRFGDDLGFQSSTLLTPNSIKKNILPQYKKIVELVHSYNKPFLLHSCGNIFNIMDDLICYVKIDAKHSNEDNIAHFEVWLNKYGDKIGNFGGVDTDVLCREDEQSIKKYVDNIFHLAKNYQGIAFGSGNSIPDYVPVSGYIAMVEKFRELRGSK